jgi:hypothetical protein
MDKTRLSFCKAALVVSAAAAAALGELGGTAHAAAPATNACAGDNAGISLSPARQDALKPN